MGWVYFLITIAVLILIGLIPICIRVVYRDEPEVWVRVLLFRFRVLPGKKKKIKLGNYRIKKFRRMRLKQRAKAREKARKAAEKKAAKQEKKRAAKEKKEADRKAGKAPKKSLRQTLRALKGKADFGLSVVRGVAGPLVKRFARYLHIDVARIHLIIGTDDAAKTAQTYGIACAALADLIELFDHVLHLHYAKSALVRVEPDFVGGKIRLDVDLTFRLRICHILALPFGAVGDFIKVFLKRS